MALWLARSEGYEVYSLSFFYGQKHDKELKAAEALALAAGVKKHRVVSINIDQWGGSSLTDKDMEVEDGDIDRTDIPVTYVPARNMIFLSIAASYAEAIAAQSIFIGVSQADYSGYVDCREPFIRSMEQTINEGTVMAAEHKKPIKIHAPFINKTKSEEIRLGARLGVPFGLTWSCYRGGEKPCGKCDSCLLRARAFNEAGIIDESL